MILPLESRFEPEIQGSGVANNASRCIRRSGINSRFSVSDDYSAADAGRAQQALAHSGFRRTPEDS
jgi:hypothetical protein